jgi:LysR family transcriptional activator of glutamate synthase operon
MMVEELSFVELRELQSLIVIAEERHFTRAAERLHMAQPALSQQFRRLERRLGVVLVERTPRYVRLTDAGEKLLVRARRIAAEVEAAVAEIDDLKGLRSGRVTIGAARATGVFAFAERLALFRSQAPGVELVVREGLSGSVTASLRSDEIDLALITPINGDDTVGLTVQTVARERLVAVLPPEHPLADRAQLRLVELLDEPLIAFPEGAVIRRRLEAVLGRRLFPAFEVGELHRMRSLVAEGLGVAVLPEGDVVPGTPAVRTVGLRDRGLVHEVQLAYRTGRQLGPPAEALFEILAR